MKILYDYQIFSLQKFGGISRYFIEIIKNLPSNIQGEISVEFSDNEYLKNSGIVSNLKNDFEPYRPVDKMLRGLKFKGKKRLLNLIYGNSINNFIDTKKLNKQFSIERIQQQNFDIFHPTYYDSYFLNYLNKKPFILTIHDMIHEIYPELLNDPELIRSKAILAKKANHIIVVSEQTKQDVIDILKIPEKKISVIYHANSLKKTIISELNLPEKFILFIGNRGGYKNFLFLSEALAPILKENNDLFIICVGETFTQSELIFLERLNIKDHFISIFVKDNELFEVYQKAVCLIYPSYYEGFGIPILEAFSANCPVLASNQSCFYEIGKDAILYFDPKNLNEITEKVNEILNNKNLAKELSQKGLLRSKMFSWKLSAEKTASVYETFFTNSITDA